MDFGTREHLANDESMQASRGKREKKRRRDIKEANVRVAWTFFDSYLSICLGYEMTFGHRTIGRTIVVVDVK